ncbi:uncharacterized protein LOC133203866 isoform X2 [Saccostrea echinata]|uniref:uncharacterized protein LOC133203866 isoform X2 n=1 Tax=Saccostrea echinata TaxID=191078 RepID=UPI002A831661|nr:uncharacterized protein LOC133203866 isoform X2 [Saccostrea echinata]
MHILSMDRDHQGLGGCDPLINPVFLPKGYMENFKIECPCQFLMITRNPNSKDNLDLSVKKSSSISELYMYISKLVCTRILNLRMSEILPCLSYSSSTFESTVSTSRHPNLSLLFEALRHLNAVSVQVYPVGQKQLHIRDSSTSVCKEETQSFSIHHTRGKPNNIFLEEVKTSLKWSGKDDKYTVKKDFVSKINGTKLKKCIPQTIKYEENAVAKNDRMFPKYCRFPRKRNVFQVWQKGILFFIFLFLLLQVVNPQPILSCPETKDTVNYVRSCPLSLSELEQARRLKNCSSFPQNCTSSRLFLYHCLPNHYLNSFVEVCSVAVDIIYGHCAEYNEGGGVIQENYQTDCTKFPKPCPIESYSSVDTYKYADCFNITPKEIPHTTDISRGEEPVPKNITEFPTNNDSNSNFELQRDLAITFGVVLPLLSLILIMLTYVWIDRKKNTSKEGLPLCQDD